MNKIKKTFLKEKENDYKLRNPKIFSKYVIVLSKNNPNIKFTFIDIVFFLVVIFYISLNYDSLIAMIETFGMLFSAPILFINEFFNQIFTFLLMLFFYGYFRNKGFNNKSED
ncbi:hypothetical protein M9B40_02935 [SAR86 cluster bacterium]|jgi:hypothetical protein|uniref:Uncharacterized protein n=1 Tax=SAR86 cluster bacterium TaxID=2030880 RepID=A0A9Q8X1Y9_9GAMM|nr:hypothetical protein [bacterium]URQ62702.1 hypothetical protein M9B40_02935 [SAR86 cluster bacterium]